MYSEHILDFEVRAFCWGEVTDELGSVPAPDEVCSAVVGGLKVLDGCLRSARHHEHHMERDSEKLPCGVASQRLADVLPGVISPQTRCKLVGHGSVSRWFTPAQPHFPKQNMENAVAFFEFLDQNLFCAVALLIQKLSPFEIFD